MEGRIKVLKVKRGLGGWGLRRQKRNRAHGRMDGVRYPIFHRGDEREEGIRKEWAEKRNGTVIWK